MNATRSSFYKVFLENDSPDVEVFSGLTALSASLTHVIFYNGGSPIHWIAIAIFIVQVLAAYPIYNLWLRHNTNILSFVVAMIISYTSLPSDIANITWCESASVGGFAGVAFTCAYSSFKTQYLRSSVKRKKS